MAIGYMVNTIVEADNEEENGELYGVEQEPQSFKVIVDSGADASIFPGRFMKGTGNDRVLQEDPICKMERGRRSGGTATRTWTS